MIAHLLSPTTEKEVSCFHRSPSISHNFLKHDCSFLFGLSHRRGFFVSSLGSFFTCCQVSLSTSTLLSTSQYGETPTKVAKCQKIATNSEQSIVTLIPFRSIFTKVLNYNTKYCHQDIYSQAIKYILKFAT